MTEVLRVQLLVREHTYIANLIPSLGISRGQPTDASLLLCFSLSPFLLLFLSLSLNKNKKKNSEKMSLGEDFLKIKKKDKRVT